MGDDRTKPTAAGDEHDPRLDVVFAGWPESSIPEEAEEPGLAGDVYGR